MKRSSKYPMALFWLVVSLSFSLLTGCDGNNMLFLAADPAAPTATPLPTCTPTTGEKFYTAANSVLGKQSQSAASVATKIHDLYLANPSANLALAKSQAINFLAYETMRWSHIEDIPVDASNSVRAIMTFISPELVRAVMLNHVLFNESAGQAQNLPDVTNTILTALDNQNQYFFLIVIQPVTTDKSNKSISISPKQIVLSNVLDIKVPTTNTDNFLNRDFKISSPPRSGLIFFPIATQDGSQCWPVLDSLHDTSMALSIEAAKIADQSVSIYWEIPFSPALSVTSAIPTPNPNAVLAANEDQPLEEWSLDIAQPVDQTYWKTLGRLVWGKLTLDYFSLR
jgi:hypothetical protein